MLLGSVLDSEAIPELTPNLLQFLSNVRIRYFFFFASSIFFGTELIIIIVLKGTVKDAIDYLRRSPFGCKRYCHLGNFSDLQFPSNHRTKCWPNRPNTPSYPYFSQSFTRLPSMLRKLLSSPPIFLLIKYLCYQALVKVVTSFSQYAEEDTSPLSAGFSILFNGFLAAADREDGIDNNLCITAYEAISDLIEYSASDTQDIIISLVPPFLQKLENTFNPTVCFFSFSSTLFLLNFVFFLSVFRSDYTFFYFELF